MSLLSRIAKKISRRFRKKGTGFLNPLSGMTEAEKLIANDWNVTVSNPEPKRDGMYRAIDRFTAQRESSVAMKTEPTRQVLRSMARDAVKRHRQLETVKFTQKHG
tara:strand:+ start:12637 stop:12951 length:315 start_codon:yes stop_codon:yes gene_type:complete